MKEIALFVGYPAAGKSSMVDQFAGYERLNRDTAGGTLDDIALKLTQMIRAGKEKFVLDNTYATVAQRKPVLVIAKEAGIPVRCIHLTTRIEDAQVNACQRMIQKYGKILGPDEISATRDANTYGPVVLFKFKKDYQEPTKSEGFDSIDEVNFVRKVGPEYKNKAIIFDYDGTLRNTKSGAHYPCDVSDIEVLPGRKELLKRLKADGFRLLGVSNQSGVAKGDLKHETAKACFEHTNKLLGVDIEYSFCPHKVPPIMCFCRKPMPGLGIQFIEKHKLDRAQTTYIGDLTSDKTFSERCGIKFSLAEQFFK